MNAPPFLRKLLHDPPARYVFELSEAGIAARTPASAQAVFHPLDKDVISVSPVRDNIMRMDLLTERVRALAPRGEKKRQRAAIIVPDYAVRVSVLDFDAFPSDAAQQNSLVRFRIKKSLPFELEEAGISYYIQPGQGKAVDVVVAAAPLEVLGRYELPFRSAGFHAGMLTTSTLAALELVRGEGIYVFAKLSAHVLTLAVTRHGVLKLFRSIEIAKGDAAEVASHLYPTFAYVEDQLGGAPERLVVCGFPHAGQDLREELAREVTLEVEPLRSRLGTPDQYNAGMLGYLESQEEAA